MKVIPVSNITGIETESQQSGYPISNLLDEHPKKQWKAEAGPSQHSPERL